MIDLIWLAIALPLGGALLLLTAGRRIGEPAAGWIASSTVGAGFVLAAINTVGFVQGGEHGETVRLFEWIPGLGLDATLLWDPLAAMMTLIVTGVGTLIHVYSIGYMHGDPRYGRFFAYLNLFAASMLILVLGGNFGLLFVGWELVGLSSYLLISFWFERPSAAAAGKKAFVVNRIGDFGFLIGLMAIFAMFGTFSYGTVFEEAAEVLTTGGATAITLLLLVGAAGKSAQLPLHVWLPDAMEGPTPVSALIHAATMVTAGVYMVARTGALFELAPFSSGVVATLGAATALFAATVALAQWDIKRVLAWSTISQLGFMFLAVGATAYVAGMFHLMTHAFFKALLFLGAGSVIHGMADEQDMRKMGGLRKAMPVTFATMAVAWVAISGIPPFAGFWSKDELLAVTFNQGGWYVVLWAVGIVTALLTAFYMTRLMYLTFFGSPRWDDGVHAHESPAVMTAPLVVLAGLSAVGGFINTPWRLTLEHFLEPAFELVELGHAGEGLTPWLLAAVSVAAALIGIALAWRRYAGRDAVPEEATLSWRVLRGGYYLDDVYGNTMVLPGKLASAWLAFVADQRVVDGAVNGVGLLVRRFGAALKPVQSGFVRNYGVILLAGTIGVLGWMLLRSGL